MALSSEFLFFSYEIFLIFRSARDCVKFKIEHEKQITK